MKPPSFMLIAGEPSGDQNAAKLVTALREKVLARSQDQTRDVQPLHTALAPRFFGAGGPRMAAAGVDLAFDLTKHSVIGISEVVKKYFQFRRMFHQLLKLAIERQPDVIIGVDYGGFNLRFGQAIKNYVRQHRSAFAPWNPKIVQFVSPQVWASRPGRAWTLANNYNLLISIFPFETAWYSRRVPRLRVEFVGHPMLDNAAPVRDKADNAAARIVLLPGSRPDEVRRHLDVITGAFALIRREIPDATGIMILPNDVLLQTVKAGELPAGITLQVGNVAQALAGADLAITKSGTITMECAAQGVPAVVFYKTSWPTYFIGKQIVSVKYLAMPNLLAGEEIFPEFIQAAATPENLSRAALSLLRDPAHRASVQARLAHLMTTLGGPGAIDRAADAILRLRA